MSTNIRSKTRLNWFAHHAVASKLIGLGCAVAVFGIAVAVPSTNAVAHGKNAIIALDNAKTALEQQDFSRAVESSSKAENELTAVKRSLRVLGALKPIPGLSTQLRAAEVITDVGLELVSVLNRGSQLLNSMLGPLKASKGDVSLATLTPADKRVILEQLSGARPELESLETHVDRAAQRLSDLPRHGLVPQLKSLAAPLVERIPQLVDAATHIIPATEILPLVAGFPDAKTYLFLLQNNTELRPTGGFIGTYGILKASSGEILSFKTADSYSLDRSFRNTLFVDPPLPLKKYNATTQWLFRDSNWSPDFPTAAEKSLEFYKLERGEPQSLDGVIAVTPTFITSLLKMSGDITVDSISFTPTNFVDKLQPLASRKELIGEMSKILLQRILALPLRRWPQLIGVLTNALQEKHMLLYSRDAQLERRIRAENWGGALTPYSSDGVAVVDANLASLKTDSVMERAITYELNATREDASATLTITYTNHGKITKTTTRYRTYTRVYVPAGSKLLRSEGALENDKLHGGRAGTVDVSEDLGRTVFGAFTSIEPGKSTKLQFTYELPHNIVEAINQGTYSLRFQKQPGTQGHALTVRLAFPKTVTALEGFDGSPDFRNTEVSLSTDLRQDRQLTVKF